MKYSEPGDSKMRSDSAMEKFSVNERATSPSGRSEGTVRTLREGEGKKRIRSWAGIGTWAGVSARRSNETSTDDQPPSPSHRSFEVVNRPARQRRARTRTGSSTSWTRSGRTDGI